MFALVAPYVLCFSATATLVTFGVASLHKLRGIHSLVRTIEQLVASPRWLSWPIALATTGLELCIVVLIAMQGEFMRAGLLVATVLLVVFSLAMALGIVRKLPIACNCFSADKEQISTYNVARNVVLLAISGVGFMISISTDARDIRLDYPGLFGTLTWSITFVSLLLNFPDIRRLLAS